MLYLIVEMSVVLLLAALVGTTVGWGLGVPRPHSRATVRHGARDAASAAPVELAALRAQVAELNARAREHGAAIDGLRREALELLQLAAAQTVARLLDPAGRDGDRPPLPVA